MLYHVSKTSDLKIIEPRKSTHKIPYVYAIENVDTALLFGAKKDDFDFILDEIDGKPVVYECYKDAFKEIYSNKSCSIYELADEGFMRGMTSWTPELVSEHPAVVVREIKIDDLYGYLMDEVKAGDIILSLYKSSKEYKSMISNHILDRIIRFEILDRKIPDKLIAKFPKLINQLEKINNGEYLD